MNPPKFPPLPLAKWQPTRDMVKAYTKFLSHIRQAFTSNQKHRWHTTLRVHQQGITTSAIRSLEGVTFDLTLNLVDHKLQIQTGRGKAWKTSILDQADQTLFQATSAAFAGMGIYPKLDSSLLSTPENRSYDPKAAETFIGVLSRINTIFKTFKAELPGESSPVQLWPSRFDLSLTWLTGKKIPGEDPQNVEKSDKRMNFGFSTGDDNIPRPYFYITAYPWPEKLSAMKLPPEVSWNTERENRAIFLYEHLVDAQNPESKLLQFLRGFYVHASKLMD